MPGENFAKWNIEQERYWKEVNPWQDRFWAQVAKSEFCWLWVGPLDRAGYGRYTKGSQHAGGKLMGAHRIAYELCKGEIPEGLDLDHLCRVSACVNPAHLEPVTRQENQRRSPRSYAYRDICNKGHSLADCWFSATGNKICRTCKTERAKERRAEQREKRGDSAS